MSAEDGVPDIDESRSLMDSRETKSAAHTRKRRQIQSESKDIEEESDC